MKKYIPELVKSRFVRNVAVLATGTVASQLVALIFVPFITRMYGPESYGLLGIFTSLLIILTPIVALSYPIAIVLPKKNQEAMTVTKLSLYIAVFMSGLILLIAILFGDVLLKLINAETISNFILLLPLAAFFAAFFQVTEQWSIRVNAFSLLAKAAFSQSLILNISKVLIGLFYPYAIILILTNIFGNLLHTFMLFIGLKKSTTIRHLGSTPCLASIAKKFYDFPLYRAPQVFINAISQSLPVLMLASFFGAAAAGFYVLGRTVMALPSQLIGKAVGDVFYPRINHAAEQGEDVYKIIVKATIALGLLGLIPFSMIIILGPELFGLVFGDEWSKAGEYAQWLSLMFYMNLINKPSVASIPVLGKQFGLVIYEIFSTGSKFIALYYAYTLYSNDLIAVMLFSIAGSLAYIILILWVLVIAKNFTVKKNAKKTS
ncbi:lipopolysaccharide biosynthesis protein [Methylophaga pinxianii]|uniref:lipopolysaccharide biosynthesis protein n=1 Tax=Methylophaga pinxianii TaxID=2881052 RepID=UPI001CF2EFB4|nr:oligosaccharide flippase family protein [Methylophaga pinxianii]MCB2428071.1 oligosaccharide flippase family protein [Methylophaga pinxianii]UPH45394.1 oligosaccharide flippase family protein [Methylophaga pinxianii]